MHETDVSFPRRHAWIVAALAMLVIVGLSDGAVAEPAGPSGSTAATDTESERGHGMDVGLGFRIGGLGFRHAKNGSLTWRDCRMNGLGLFATLDFHRNLFAELSAEYYHATGRTVAHGMDRLSLYVLGALGARVLPDAIISPYVQLGAGPELTLVEGGGHQHSKLLAAPFVGIGGELNFDSLKLGTHLRSYLMGLPQHTHGSDGSSGHRTIAMRYEAAAQMQFFARWEF